MTSELEKNIRTLIVQCEYFAKDDKNDWLLKKYIRSLDTMINELEISAVYVELISIHFYWPIYLLISFVSLKQKTKTKCD